MPNTFLSHGSKKTLEEGVDLKTYVVYEVSYVPRVGHAGSDRVLRLSNHGPLIDPAHPRWLADDVVQRLRLLQLAQVVVLDETTREREIEIKIGEEDRKHHKNTTIKEFFVKRLVRIECQTQIWPSIAFYLAL